MTERKAENKSRFAGQVDSDPHLTAPIHPSSSQGKGAETFNVDKARLLYGNQNSSSIDSTHVDQGKLEALIRNRGEAHVGGVTARQIHDKIESSDNEIIVQSGNSVVVYLRQTPDHAKIDLAKSAAKPKIKRQSGHQKHHGNKPQKRKKH